MRNLATLGLLAALALGWTPQALAAACPLAAPLRGSCAAAIDTHAATVLNATTTAPYRLMAVDNESTTATLACTDDGTTPAINTAGSYTIAAGATRTWSASNVIFIGPLICISSAAPAVSLTAIAAAGVDYAANDTITLTGGTFSTATVITVLTVDGSGHILTASLTTPGLYTVTPANPVAQGSTSGIGTGATFTLVYGSPATVKGQ